MDLPWPQVVFVVASTITLPLHFAILISVVRRRKHTLFHILVLSQGLADVGSLINYAFVTTARDSQLFNEFFWSNKQFLANYGYRSTYYFVMVRNIGVTMMSLQRYICVCQSGKKIEKIISRTPAVFFAIFQWGIALLIVSPIMQLSYDVTYEMRPKLEVSIPPSLLALGNMIVILSSAALVAICIVCYVLIISYILRNISNRSQSKQHELRLSAQVAGLVIAFIAQLVYNGGSYILNYFGPVATRNWRTIGPLLYGFLSCVHPWTCLAFNQEIRNGVPGISRYCVKRKEDSISFTMVFWLSRTKH
ncbi:hypothetical protein GCK32_000959 [Trichostrongylus colubriformis]|uniref:G-protein coupled receptors family 1 profile domain-containing protein n=1 Tax=Trichostrongylus colubriformis TaxID=6319 RepID=A0AAN8F0N1_TRICO